MIITTLLIVAVVWLAWSNGANDNFIGVATLYGSRTCTYRAALTWATLATGAGAAVSISFAHLPVVCKVGRRDATHRIATQDGRRSIMDTTCIPLTIQGRSGFDSCAEQAAGQPLFTQRRIATGEHCFACTAGCGSSCGGALA